MEAENKSVFATLGQLHVAVSDLYNEKVLGEQITPSVVYLRIKEWNLRVETKPSRVRQPMSDEQKAAMKAGKKKKILRTGNKKFLLHDMLTNEQKRHAKLVDRVSNGNKVSAIKLMCLQCTCYNTDEIKNCEIKKCALWLIRPYSKGSDIEDNIEDENAQHTLQGSI